MTAAAFWDWFYANRFKYLFLNDENMTEKDAALDELQQQLDAYHKGVYFLIGGNKDNDQEIVFTADGDVDHFAAIEALVAEAPSMENWRAIAFKQPLNYDFEVEMHGIRMSPSRLCFMPLAHADDPTNLGLRIGIPEYEASRDKAFFAIAFLIIDNLLGERAAAKNIRYMECVPYPQAGEEDGFFELMSLPDFIRWKEEMDAAGNPEQ